MTANQELTAGGAALAGERADRHRRIARLFALAMTCDPYERAAIMARIRELLSQEGSSDGR